MQYGLARLSLFPFVQVGFVAVVVALIGIALVFALGGAMGGRRAIRYVNGWMVALAVVLTGNVVWAVVSDQWLRFGAEIGWQVLFELLVLGAMFLLGTWFMGVRYAQSLDR